MPTLEKKRKISNKPPKFTHWRTRKEKVQSWQKERDNKYQSRKDCCCQWPYPLCEPLLTHTSTGDPPTLAEDAIISLMISLATVLLIGGFIWALSQRRASTFISQYSSGQRSRASYTHGLNRTGFYRHSACEHQSNLSLASLTFQQQASLKQADSFPRKSTFRNSTFHPFLQSLPLPVETDWLVTLASSNISFTIKTFHSLGHPDFQWHNNSLRIGLSTPPSPA